MNAVKLVDTRVVYPERAFADLVVWKVARPVSASAHAFKYRLAFVVEGICVIRFDNEAGNGDHIHSDGVENPYRFISPDQLIADFQKAIARWNDENSHS